MRVISVNIPCRCVQTLIILKLYPVGNSIVESSHGQVVDRSNVNPSRTLAEGKAVFSSLLLATYYEISKYPKHLSSK